MRISAWSADVCSSVLHHLCRDRGAAEPQGPRHMMFDRLDTDAEFGGDLLVSPTMHAVHHEDTSGLGRHGTNHPPIEVEHVHRLDPQSLIGAGRAIAPEKDRKEHTSELQSILRTSSAVYCLKKK